MPIVPVPLVVCVTSVILVQEIISILVFIQFTMKSISF